MKKIEQKETKATMKKGLKKANTMIKTKKSLSTFEREMKNAKFKKAFDKSYKEFLLSELLIAIMENDGISVRDLAKEVGLSPTIIQKIRSGKQDDLRVSNFVTIVRSCGYKVILEKDDERIEIKDTKDRKKHHLNFVHA
jgi:DNA-binding Xre family transcriptional regulator